VTQKKISDSFSFLWSIYGIYVATLRLYLKRHVKCLLWEFDSEREILSQQPRAVMTKKRDLLRQSIPSFKFFRLSVPLISNPRTTAIICFY